MLLYKYDETTKEYLGYFEAYLDPLESIAQKKDVYVYPPCSTDLVPPPLREGYIILFKNNKWEEVEDHRGTKIWDKNGKSMEVTELGPIPEEYFLERVYTLKEVKELKLEEIKKDYDEEYKREEEFDKVKVNIENAVWIKKNLEAFEDFEFIFFDDTKITTEEAKRIIKYLYIKNILLSRKRKSLIEKVTNSKDKNEVQNLEISFDIDIDSYMNLPLEQVYSILV